MILSDFTIREIQQKDNAKIAKAIRDVLIEYGVPKVGTAYADEYIRTLEVKDWKNEKPDLHKKPTIFIIHKE